MNVFIRIFFYMLGGVLMLAKDLFLAGIAGVIVYGALTAMDSSLAGVLGAGVFMLELIWLRYADTDEVYEPDPEVDPDE